MKSRYTCQGGKLRLACPSHQVLHIFKALFGREEPGSSICPSPKINSTSCAAKRSMEVVSARCTNKSECTVPADSAMFGGDPCPGTFKYLDIVYACRKWASRHRVNTLFCRAVTSILSQRLLHKMTHSRQSWKEREDSQETQYLASILADKLVQCICRNKLCIYPATAWCSGTECPEPTPPGNYLM